MLVQGKVYTIWSPRGNIGSTLTSIAIAKKLSETKGKTLLVDLNFSRPRFAEYLNLKDGTKSLDNLYPYASGDTLSGDIIEGNCERTNDLYVLRGTLNPSLMNDFPRKDIVENTVKAMKDHFTYVVIDVNSDINNPGTYFALRYADKVFVPMERNVISVLALHELRDIVRSIFGIDKFRLIFNNDKEDVHMPIKDIEDSLGIKSGGSLPYIKHFTDVINKGELLKIDSNRDFREYVAAVDEFIEKNIGEIKIDDTKKRGILDRILGRNK